jgi:hypothetical protein
VRHLHRLQAQADIVVLEAPDLPEMRLPVFGPEAV